jgi:hypothetical protein
MLPTSESCCSSGFEHKIINHAETYVNGNIYTNGLENFWSPLKRSIGVGYVSVEPFHLFRYIDEQAFRFNNREDMKTVTASIWPSAKSSESV